MNDILYKDIMAETYKDFDDMLWKIVWRVWLSFGGDIDELKSKANLFFVEAYNELQPLNKHQRSAWLYRRVFDYLRRHLIKQRNRTIETTAIPVDCVAVAKKNSSSFNLSLLFESISEDAKTVVNLVFIPGVTESDLEEGFKGYKTRISIRKHLKALGWTGRRIKECFTEIGRIECWY